MSSKCFSFDRFRSLFIMQRLLRPLKIVSINFQTGLSRALLTRARVKQFNSLLKNKKYYNIPFDLIYFFQKKESELKIPFLILFDFIFSLRVHRIILFSVFIPVYVCVLLCVCGLPTQWFDNEPSRFHIRPYTTRLS